MEKWLYIVQTVCAEPEKDAEFQEWYDKVHVPDLLKAPGFVSGTRYVNKEPNEVQGRYVAIYEVETDDIDKTWEQYRAYIDGIRAQGRLSPLCKVVQRQRVKQIVPTRERPAKQQASN